MPRRGSSASWALHAALDVVEGIRLLSRPGSAPGPSATDPASVAAGLFERNDIADRFERLLEEAPA